MRRFFKALVFVIGVLVVGFCGAAEAKDIAFGFATPEEGRALLTARDDYVQRLSPFDRSAKLKTDKALSEEEYLARVGQNAVAWSADDQAAVQVALAELAPKINALGLDWPDEVLFVKTTGAEEGQAAYTRANAIFLPPGRLAAAAREGLSRLIIHELFHVLSRHNPALRDELYAAIGFQPCGEIDLPPKLARVKITNPDAPVNAHCIRLAVNSEPAWMMPIIYSSAETYNVAAGGEFFKYLKFGFLRLNGEPGQPAVYTDDNTRVLDPKSVTGFFEQVGKNTNYIIHPEEILADNFSFLLLEKPDLPSPEVVAKMKEVLAKAPSQARQDQTRLSKAIAASVLPLRVEGAALSESGGTWLTTQAKAADILMIGEMHGVADIAHAATLLARAQDATVYAAEVGPTAAWKLTDLLRAKNGSFDEAMADPRRANSFAFLNMREEAAFARAVLQNGKKTDMWGLDQEFITSGPLLMDRLATFARTSDQKEAVQNARTVLDAKFFSLSKVDAGVFAALTAAFEKAPEEARTLIQDIALSAQIYDALGYAQNAPREELMKRKFLMHWRAATGRNGNTPKVVMKMGSNHLQAGLSTTMVPALGGFVRHLAMMNGKNVFSVLILCGPDGAQRAFDASTSSCKAEFEGSAAALGPYLRDDGATLFRTESLRAMPSTLRRLGWGEDLRQYVFSYDAIVVLKDAKPANHIAAPDPKWFSAN